MEQWLNDAALKDVLAKLGKEEYALSMGQIMSNDAELEGAQVLLKRKECASSMVQQGNDAALNVAQIKLRKEECASGTGQMSNDAAVRDANVSLRREECASGMGQRENANDAELEDAQIMLKREECALNTEQRSNDAALKGAQIIPNEEEYARDTVHTATITKNLQLSHRVWDQNLKRLLRLILISAFQQLPNHRMMYLKRLPFV
jgi:hypothetical protein